MTDEPVTPARRKNMQAVKSRNTKPELKLRTMLHAAGYRYRLHTKELPGKPDIVFPARKCVLFVHGCFWHLHSDCRKATIPATRTEFWMNKLQANKERDKRNVEALEKSGWRVMTIWECDIREFKNKIPDNIKYFLDLKTPKV